jgi:diadenosine tetraphosphatase ApaH/serine/threonine PP2A family protein phosphatase
MHYGIISDIHSNLPALVRVLEEIRSLKVDEIYCLGDIVGYASEPRECIESTRRNAKAIVLGNHDAGAAGTAPLDYFNSLAREALLWTRKILSPQDLDWLRALPLLHECGDFLIVHSSPVFPERWSYIFAAEHALEALRQSRHHLTFVGHTHCPAVFSLGEEGLRSHYEPDVVLQEGRRYLVNPGSVGQPRDGDPRASFMTYRSDLRRIALHRVSYDIGRTQDSIFAAGLPRELALRLGVGY